MIQTYETRPMASSTCAVMAASSSEAWSGISNNPWVFSLDDASVRVVCFHPAGCQPTIFMAWKRHFSARVSAVPVVLPMHGSRLFERMPQSFQEIACDLLDGCPELFDRPVLLFGHSMGAMIAYELACRLQQHSKPPVALVVSGAQSPDRRETVDRTIGLTDDGFLDVLRTYGSIGEDLLHDQGFLSYYLPIARIDFALCEKYEWQTQPALACPIHTFNGEEDTHISRDGVEQWNRFTRASCTHHLFEGGHFYCDENPAEVCAQIEAILQPHIR
ncbi:MAG: alpha/beta fold hydrolase [Coriobacteriales bacterium]|nr:alpha/beta fold hydrolase [Coriobacteriales bacterium]